MADAVDKPDQLASGVIDLLVLRLLFDGESYVYAITSELAGHGLKELPETTVYTAVKRLERNGLLSSRTEAPPGVRRRRYYQLTPNGRRELDRRAESWRDLETAVRSVFRVGRV